MARNFPPLPGDPPGNPLQIDVRKVVLAIVALVIIAGAFSLVYIVPTDSVAVLQRFWGL